MGEAAKPLLFEGFRAGCHVVLRGRRGTLSHSNLFDNASKVSNLAEVSHEMLVLLLPHVSSSSVWFSCGIAVSMGKLQNLSFSKVSKQVVMSFCVAGVALCMITCQKWRKSRTKSSFFCAHVSRLDSLVFLWRLRVYRGSFTLYTLHSTLLTLHSTLHTLHFTFYTRHFTLHTPHFTLYTLHFPLHTPHFTLYTPHFTFYIPHFTL